MAEYLFTICSGFVALFALGFIYDYLRYRSQAKRSLRNRHVVITGGSSGIGKSFACEVAKRGANVTLLARDVNKLKTAEAEVKGCCIIPTQRVASLSLDVCDTYERIEESFQQIEKEGGPIYILMNCAGTAICGILEDVSSSDILKTINLNCVGSILATKAAIKSMKSREEGHIIFTASEAAFVGIYGMAAYSASKYALRGFAEALQMEVKCNGIKVTVGFPPDTDTPGFVEEEKSKPKETSLLCQSSGLYQPDEVAAKILNDSLGGCFLSCVGIDGLMLTTLNAGMTPENSFTKLCAQILLMGFMRVIALCYTFSFYNTIKKCKLEKNVSKKAE